MKNFKYICLSFLLIGFVACEPAVDDKIELGALPVASFEISAGATPNYFILTNTTDGAFITNWDLGTAEPAEGAVVEAYYPNKGDYEVTMTTFNQGGHDIVTKTVTVTQNDPDACQGVIETLTGCDEKVWKLAPEAGAIHVGPNIEEIWWNNSETDVIDRACHFNDEYIFRLNGEFEYDNKGDFWADSDGSGNVTPADLGLAVGCQDASSWPEKYKVWDSNVHTFSATANALTVSGEGAWIGLYKIGTASEVAAPQSSVTFNIASITENRMVIYTDYGGLAWRITLVSE